MFAPLTLNDFAQASANRRSIGTAIHPTRRRSCPISPAPGESSAERVPVIPTPANVTPLRKTGESPAPSCW